MVEKGLKTAHNQASASHIQQMGLVLDHLVDALGGDPSCTLRRATILVDIDQHPGTTQAEVMDRLKLHKSALNRDIEWLNDHACLNRQQGQQDGRVIHMLTCGYSKKNLDLALDYFDSSHKKLQDFLEGLITIFKDQKPSFRDAKLLATAADLGAPSKHELFARSYDGPTTTNARALEGLIEHGLITKAGSDG